MHSSLRFKRKPRTCFILQYHRGGVGDIGMSQTYFLRRRVPSLPILTLTMLLQHHAPTATISSNHEFQTSNAPNPANAALREELTTSDLRPNVPMFAILRNSSGGAYMYSRKKHIHRFDQARAGYEVQRIHLSILLSLRSLVNATNKYEKRAATQRITRCNICGSA